MRVYVTGASDAIDPWRVPEFVDTGREVVGRNELTLTTAPQVGARRLAEEQAALRRRRRSGRALVTEDVCR